MRLTPQTLDHFHNPRNAGRLEHPTATGSEGRPGRGNYVVIQVKVAGERITEIAFQTHGCSAAIACGSVATELARGKMLVDVEKITAEEIERHLGGLPLGKGHCAGLAAKALRNAVRNAREG